MDVTFVAYGPVREVVGTKEQVRDVPAGTTVGDLLTSMVDEHPDLAELLYDDGGVSDAISLTVDGTNVARLDGLETELEGGEELRVAPPIHGG